MSNVNNVNSAKSGYVASTEQANLVASDGAGYDYFGQSVSISADGAYAVIGAYVDAIGANSAQGSAYIFVRSGASWTQQAKLVASDGAANDFFGWSVSISADGAYAVIGARVDVGANSNQGSAYIFVRSGASWTQQAKLAASDGAAGDQFSRSVSISADGAYAVIGAYVDAIGANSAQGSAYIFVRSGASWTQQAKLVASDGAANDFFGWSVSISADGAYAVIGARVDVGANSNQGSAYIFVRSGASWTQQAKLAASDGAANDFFGLSVAISADGAYAVIGVVADDVGANTDQGSAYIFVRSGTSWTQQAKLVASYGAADDFFGCSVSISADGAYAVIGARYDGVGANTNQGSAYIFVRSSTSWTQQAKLVASDGADGDWFGQSVSISADGAYVVIGASYDDVGTNTNQGSAYIFSCS
jgi:virulence-associated protein VapD